jgi:metal-responsive CopG/Arc/MetJ family transcriptional regulator
MAKKVAHGGRRKGAGRPPKEDGKTVVIAASVPEELAVDLDRFAEANGWSRSKAVTEALRGLLARKKTRRE